MTMVRREITLGIIVFAFLLVNSAMISAITGSMGNARMVLYPEVDGSKEVKIEKTILVKNVNDVSINITLVLDPESEKFIQLTDKSFIMEPNTEKNARFTVKVKNEGSYEGKINVFFKPVEGKEAGVVLSSTIIVIAKKNQDTQNTNIEDTTDDQSDNTNDESDGTDNAGITGNVVGNGKKLSIGVLFLIITTVLLLIVLVALIVIAPKKIKSLKNSNSRGKK